MALRSTQPLTEMFTRRISWGKCGRCVWLTNLPPPCAVVVKSGNLNFLEPSGPLQACNGTDLLSKFYPSSSFLSSQNNVLIDLWTLFTMRATVVLLLVTSIWAQAVILTLNYRGKVIGNVFICYFIFIIPCIVIFYGMTNWCNNVQWDLFLCKSTLHVSGPRPLMGPATHITTCIYVILTTAPKLVNRAICFQIYQCIINRQ